MGYYIKVSFNNKTKKFIVHNPKQINLSQVKNCFCPAIPSQIPLKFQINYRTETPKTIKNQQQLLQYFLQNEFPNGDSIRIKIQVSHPQNEQKEDQQFYQYFLNTNKITKTRSQSQELDSNLLTNEFNIKQLQHNLSQSMKISSKSIEQLDNYIKKKQCQLIKLKELKRETNLLELVQFLNRRFS